jgi:spore coat protein U-like protein
VLFPSDFRLIAGGLALALVAVPGPAALAQTADLSVTAQIEANCVLNGGSLSFGLYSATETAATPGQGTFSYQCTNGSNITLSLGPGLNSEGESRAMAAGEGTLLYELYQDAGREQEWSTAGEALIVQDTPSSLETVDVYGSIVPGQESPAGNYSDTVQITLNIN